MCPPPQGRINSSLFSIFSICQTIFFLTCRKSWLGLSWFEMIQIRLKMADSLWSQRNQIDRHQFISHMSKPHCSFRRLGDAKKCTSNTELPGPEAPLALLQLKLWDITRQQTSLLLCTGCDNAPRQHCSATPPVGTALAMKAQCAGPASARPLFSRQVEKAFLHQVRLFHSTKLS